MNFRKDDKLPIKLFFQDETRFGRINKTSKCWTPPNQRAVIGQQAGWHRSKDLKVIKNIVPMFLPPYSPELNPAEHLWDYIREKKKFNNNVFNSLADVENKLSIALFDMSKDIDTIKSLCNFKWLNYTY